MRIGCAYPQVTSENPDFQLVWLNYVMTKQTITKHVLIVSDLSDLTDETALALLPHLDRAAGASKESVILLHAHATRNPYQDPCKQLDDVTRHLRRRWSGPLRHSTAIKLFSRLPSHSIVIL